ncbi:PstS family phosphate ABC transporter substrate-binding protein [Evansella tamaricis]|uniref:PstS family phosphate ABC transporter substrate-binding protein n=1 Tax=Evansella tamaricis TaxID=2069301 RepID=UPI0031B862C7
MKKYLVALSIAALTVFTAACGSDDNSADAGELSGSVSIDGSGTVYPLMSRIADEFMTIEDVSVEVGRAGTSAGMQKYVVGETDFSNASRPIKDEEVAELDANEIESKEFKVALDGLTLVINPENDWATELTEEEVKTMFVTGNIKDDDKVLWSDIRPEWPAEEINFYGPNENHGTYEFFVDVIIEKQDLVAGINLQQEYSTLVSLVSDDKNGIAFFGFGYYVNNDDKLKAVSIDFGNGPVAPSLETIGEDGPYANFTRPVFTNLNLDAAKEKPQVKAFAEYIFSTGAADFAGETGFAPLPDEELAEALEFVQNLK